MPKSIQKVIIISMLILISIPFILLTDLFPFMRFGMFAEPVKQQIQLEVYEVSYIDSLDHETILDPNAIGIKPQYFLYLARNYYYRKESEIFLDHINQIANKKNITEWRFKKITPYKEAKADTLIISKKKYEKE